MTESYLNFYNGKVNIAMAELPKFIETAKYFEIESLTNNESVFNNPSCEDNSLQEMDLISSDSNQEKINIISDLIKTQTDNE